MDLRFLNPYPNYTGNSFEPIVQMNAMGSFDQNKQQVLRSVRFSGHDPWLCKETPNEIYMHNPESTRFPLIINDDYLNNRMTIQEKGEFHMRDLGLETTYGQVVPNLTNQDTFDIYNEKSGAGLHQNKEFSIKRFVYTDKDGRKKLKKSILSKY